MYGMGSGQDTVKDHAQNIVLGAGTGYLKNALGNQVYGRGAYPLERDILNGFVDNGINYTYHNLFED